MHLTSAAFKCYCSDLTGQWLRFYIFNYLEHRTKTTNILQQKIERYIGNDSFHSRDKGQWGRK